MKVDVAVGDGVGVSVGVGVRVAAVLGLDTAAGPDVDAGVGSGLGLDVGVTVAVGLRVGDDVWVGVGVLVSVGLLVAVGVPSKASTDRADVSEPSGGGSEEVSGDSPGCEKTKKRSRAGKNQTRAIARKVEVMGLKAIAL